MTSSLNTISTLVEQQLPRFIREDHPVFVQFLRNYYQFLEQPGNPVYEFKKFEDNYDIDATRESLLRYFKNKILPSFPEETEMTTERIIKASRDFYAKKGTPESFKFLFRVLYDKDVEVFFPKSQIFKASDGKWVQPQAFRLTLLTVTLKSVYILINGQFRCDSLTNGKKISVGDTIEVYGTLTGSGRISSYVNPGPHVYYVIETSVVNGKIYFTLSEDLGGDPIPTTQGSASGLTFKNTTKSSDSLDLNKLEKKKAYGSLSRASCVIESAIRTIDKSSNREIVEIYISSLNRFFQNGEYLEVEYIDDNDQKQLFSEKIIGAISSIKINPNRRGKKYKVGDPVAINGGLDLTSETRMKAVAEVEDVTTGSLKTIIVSHGGYGFRIYPNTIIDIDTTNSSGGTGANVIVTGVDSDAANTITVGCCYDSILYKKNAKLLNLSKGLLIGDSGNPKTITAEFSKFTVNLSSKTSFSVTFSGYIGTGGVASTTMTVTSISGSQPLESMMSIRGENIPLGTYIVSQITGTTGATGTYKISTDNTQLKSFKGFITHSTMNVTSTPTSTLATGDLITGGCIPDGINILSLLTGSGSSSSSSWTLNGGPYNGCIVPQTVFNGYIGGSITTSTVVFEHVATTNASGGTSVLQNSLTVEFPNSTWGPLIRDNPSYYEVVFGNELLALKITGATNISGNSWTINGEWPANANATPFKIKHKSSLMSIPLAVVNSGGSVPINIYYFKVVAYDDTGSAIQSYNITEPINVVSLGNQTVYISWVGRLNASSYRIYYATSVSGLADAQTANYVTSTINEVRISTLSGTSSASIPTTSTTMSVLYAVSGLSDSEYISDQLYIAGSSIPFGVYVIEQLTGTTNGIGSYRIATTSSVGSSGSPVEITASKRVYFQDDGAIKRNELPNVLYAQGFMVDSEWAFDACTNSYLTSTLESALTIDQTALHSITQITVVNGGSSYTDVPDFNAISLYENDYSTEEGTGLIGTITVPTGQHSNYLISDSVAYDATLPLLDRAYYTAPSIRLVDPNPVLSRYSNENKFYLGWRLFVENHFRTIVDYQVYTDPLNNNATIKKLVLDRKFENNVNATNILRRNLRLDPRPSIASSGRLAKIKVINKGSGYSIGDVVNFVGTGYGAAATVSAISGTGEILSINLSNIGEGYPSPPELSIYSPDGGTGAIISAIMLGDGENLTAETDTIGQIKSIKIINRGSDYTTTPTVSLKICDIYISGIGENDSIVENDIVYQSPTGLIADSVFRGIVDNYDASTKIIRTYNYSGTASTGKLYVSRNDATILQTTVLPLTVKIYDTNQDSLTYGEFLYDKIYPWSYGNGKARATAYFLNGLIKYNGYYLNTDGHLSSDKKLQDSDLYHNYSYSLASEVQYTDYNKPVRDIVHPIGTKMSPIVIKSIATNVGEHIGINVDSIILTTNTYIGTCNIAADSTLVDGVAENFRFLADVGDMININPYKADRNVNFVKIITSIDENTSAGNRYLTIESPCTFIGDGRTAVAPGSNILQVTGSDVSLLEKVFPYPIMASSTDIVINDSETFDQTIQRASRSWLSSTYVLQNSVAYNSYGKVFTAHSISATISINNGTPGQSGNKMLIESSISYTIYPGMLVYSGDMIPVIIAENVSGSGINSLWVVDGNRSISSAAATIVNCDKIDESLTIYRRSSLIYSADGNNNRILFNNSGWVNIEDVTNATERTYSYLSTCLGGTSNVPYNIIELISVSSGTMLKATSTGMQSISMAKGRTFIIKTVGTINWTQIGASEAIVGASFIYNGQPITGTGVFNAPAQLIMKDTTTNKYYTMLFSYWPTASAGMAYTRSQINVDYIYKSDLIRISLPPFSANANLTTGSGNTTTTINLSTSNYSASSIDDYYTGMTVTVTNPSGVRKIIDYNGYTKIATLNLALSTAATATSNVRITSDGQLIKSIIAATGSTLTLNNASAIHTSKSNLIYEIIPKINVTEYTIIKTGYVPD